MRRPNCAVEGRLGLAAFAAAVGMVWPAVADAHLVTTGLGPIYDGVSHVLMSPEDLVPILAMAMLGGLNGPAAGRRTLFALTGAWMIGGLAGFRAAADAGTGVAAIASFLVLGGLTAADRRLSPRVVTLLAVSVGLMHGWINGAGIAAAQQDVIGLIGIAGIAFVLVALVAASVASLRAAWTRVAIRVAGSWIAAIGLLMAGWALRGPVRPF